MSHWVLSADQTWVLSEDQTLFQSTISLNLYIHSEATAIITFIAVIYKLRLDLAQCHNPVKEER
jgi:hypothetical protein